MAYVEHCIWNGHNVHPRRHAVEQKAQAALDAVKRNLDAEVATG